jgi:hypothetical protein
VPVRIARQAIYCANYIIHDVVQLYQTTVALPGYFLKAVQRNSVSAFGPGGPLCFQNEWRQGQFVYSLPIR